MKSQPILRVICVYCGSKPGRKEIYQQTARELGQLLAQSGIDLVYGGGQVGIMGTLAESVLASGGRVIGIIPEPLLKNEIAHPGLTELVVVGSMHERKQRMADLSDAFIALPGGLGTLEEILEMLTWTQLGFHRKKCGFLNCGGYYDRLLDFFDYVAEEGFVKHPESLFQVDTTAAKLLEKMGASVK